MSCSTARPARSGPNRRCRKELDLSHTPSTTACPTDAKAYTLWHAGLLSPRYSRRCVWKTIRTIILAGVKADLSDAATSSAANAERGVAGARRRYRRDSVWRNLGIPAPGLDVGRCSLQSGGHQARLPHNSAYPMCGKDEQTLLVLEAFDRERKRLVRLGHKFRSAPRDCTDIGRFVLRYGTGAVRDTVAISRAD